MTVYSHQRPWRPERNGMEQEKNFNPGFYTQQKCLSGVSQAFLDEGKPRDGVTTTLTLNEWLQEGH